MTSTGTDRSPSSGSPPPLPDEGGGLVDERDYAGRQIRGARAVQEDSYGVVPRAEFGGDLRDLFLVVADGMGGHAAGEVASSLAVNSFAETFLESGTACDAGRLWDCLEEANRRIGREISARGSEVQGMGTTLLAVLLRGTEARWISVGDSPLYLISGGKIKRLNQIHSKAAELAKQVEQGLITESEASQDPERHVLVSALIGEAIYAVDDSPPLAVKAGDFLIAATDGLDTLSQEEVFAVVSSLSEGDAATVAEGLLQAVESREAPKQDNTTVVVVRLPG